MEGEEIGLDAEEWDAALDYNEEPRVLGLCEVCGKKGRSGRSCLVCNARHKKNKEEQEMAEPGDLLRVFRDLPDVACTSCGRHFVGQQALGTHRARAHKE